MKFFLDQNVDARVVGIVESYGHHAWTAEQANLAAEEDPNLSVYAHDHGAALMTHDIPFSKKARERVIGQHVWLHCTPPAARAVVDAHLPDAVSLLQRHQDLFIELRTDGLTATFASQAWSPS